MSAHKSTSGEQAADLAMCSNRVTDDKLATDDGENPGGRERDPEYFLRNG